MKKLLLLVGLVVLFFAQASYAGREGTYKGFKSGLDWADDDSSAGTAYPVSVYYKGKGHYTSKIQIQFRGQGACFDFNSKTYFNIDRCEKLEFSLMSLYTSKEKTQRLGKNFINDAVKDICEDAVVKINGGKLNSAIPLLGRGGTRIIVKCPKVLANKKIGKEEKKLAEKKRKAKEEEEKRLAEAKKKEEEAKQAQDNILKPISKPEF